MVIQFKYVNPHCPFRNLLWISHGNSQRYYLPYPFIITMPVRGRRNLVQGRVLKHRRKVVSIRFDSIRGQKEFLVIPRIHRFYCLFPWPVSPSVCEKKSDWMRVVKDEGRLGRFPDLGGHSSIPHSPYPISDFDFHRNLEFTFNWIIKISPRGDWFIEITRQG